MNRFHTPVDGRLDHVMYQKHDAESFVFSVKACTGIMIGLYGPYYGDDGYFIWLGGGSGMDRWNGISKRKDVEPEVKVTNDRWPPTVQCETAVDFWVSWDNKRVAAGEGRQVSDDVMIWKRFTHCCPLCRYSEFSRFLAEQTLEKNSGGVGDLGRHGACVTSSWWSNLVWVTQKIMLLTFEFQSIISLYGMETISVLMTTITCYRYIQTKMSSFWRNFHHWLYWTLPFWQLAVQPKMIIPSKWRHFRFNDTCNFLQQNLIFINFTSATSGLTSLVSRFAIMTSLIIFQNFSSFVWMVYWFLQGRSQKSISPNAHVIEMT